METDFLITCPFCFENIWIEFYPQDGAVQQMITDCEVCCHPIEYKIDFSSETTPIPTVMKS